ncbi:polyketide cyclase [Paenibacillus pectinilyticus]|uniref:Polyketide cyclase n=1 Tax=Paenibacillus pectinilyticus TaxID=512399 RepID=A0A1C0ZXX4_9BACL|nr:SRPBCC family protein [Paenibacillus pectinilyticus]OCT12954.1 polyketide cyclase [Paenibacillus pectinilyticus]
MTEKQGINNDTSAAEAYELIASRVFDAPRDLVYEAWTNPDHLAKWWGPNGFTNTFHEFDLRPGGAWQFVMHGPNGVDYPNKSEFVEIGPERIVLRHLSAPHFQITAILEDLGSQTKLTFRQLFSTASEFNAASKYAPEANEQNLDRLGIQLQKMKSV